MKINISLLDVDINTEMNEYEVFILNGYSNNPNNKVDKSILRVKYSALSGIELEVFGYVLLK